MNCDAPAVSQSQLSVKDEFKAKQESKTSYGTFFITEADVSHSLGEDEENELEFTIGCSNLLPELLDPSTSTLCIDSTPETIQEFSSTVPFSDNLKYKIEFELVKNPEGETHDPSYSLVKTYSCNSCDYQTSQHSSINSHAIVHTGEKRFLCEVCGYGTYHKLRFESHLRVHTGERPFVCHLCDYKGATRNRLNVHLRTHTGEKKFFCGFCDYKASNTTILQHHIRTHTGEKPYACNMCDYKGAKKGNLVVHMRTHTGEKQFQCYLCDYRASHKVSLKHHIMCIHTKKKKAL